MAAQSRIVPHRQGLTRAVYSKDGQYIFTTGADCIVRRFRLGSNEEPLLLDPLHEDPVTSIAISNDKVVTCSEDASVAIFDITGGESSKICRSTLPAREVAFSPDGQWVAVASDETRVKIVNTENMLRVMELTAALAKSIKHVAFHPSGNMVSTVDTNGVIRVYSLSTEQPSIIETLAGIVPIVHSTESPVSCKVAWHPDGSCFAAPTALREISVYDRIDWKRHVVFEAAESHIMAITDICWSPNGAYLVSAAQDKSIIVWESKTQSIVRKLNVPTFALQVVWHPQKNVISWTTEEGELFTHEDIVPSTYPSPYERPIHASPVQLIQNAAKSVSTHQHKVNGNGIARQADAGHVSDDEGLLDTLEDAGADWIDDDDGAGYIPNLEHRNKRPADIEGHDRQAKRGKYSAAQLHEKVQPGSTPWRGQRRYLTLNMIGWIWTVEQDTHNTVTVEFHDREAHRQYHFTDSALYSFAALDETGALFASPSRNDNGVQLAATIHYRPHESWAAHSNWTCSLPQGEDIEAISLSNSGVVVCSSSGYIRIYTLNGLPKRMLQSKNGPVISAISNGNHVMVVTNGPVKVDGTTQLLYSIYHTKVEETIQEGDVVALQPTAALKSLFYGDDGNPYIYSTNGVLSVLTKWNMFGQAQWVPILDTNLLQRRVGKDENYWPVAVSQNKFHCIILKGAERHPYFPRPITSEFDFLMPVTTPDHLDKSQASLEIALLQDGVLSSLAEVVGDEDESDRLEMLVERSLLQLLNLSCKNEQDARAMDICESLRRTVSLDAAVKIAGHHNRINLAARIGRIQHDDTDT